ncbi:MULTISPECIES: hypothetical protein [unclassified Streptomyces]|uniref:hypothetical protein n=1 Tax=unclassified Streptomyces TaxID=2593676 RepID=UPI000898A01F|nr:MULTISPECIES: hypothetical protein [unclassified Streptomyces]SEE28571.1 hypothetical protein SAMN05428943_4279 [Streptomyces sp. 2314.4]SOE11893.1 hypothetical protein SAMN06272775_2881 [Streptomyces sp. 2323.1]
MDDESLSEWAERRDSKIGRKLRGVPRCPMPARACGSGRMSGGAKEHGKHGSQATPKALMRAPRNILRTDPKLACRIRDAAISPAGRKIAAWHRK